MQLMYEMRPKPFHDDIGAKPNRHFARKLTKKFWVKTLVLEIGGFGFLMILGFPRVIWTTLNLKHILWSLAFDLDC
jgi:hypothetical protein